MLQSPLAGNLYLIRVFHKFLFIFTLEEMLQNVLSSFSGVSAVGWLFLVAKPPCNCVPFESCIMRVAGRVTLVTQVRQVSGADEVL